MIRLRCCDTCASWASESGNDVAECRRHAPMQGDDDWPSTWAGDWCAEHQFGFVAAAIASGALCTEILRILTGGRKGQG